MPCSQLDSFTVESVWELCNALHMHGARMSAGQHYSLVNDVVSARPVGTHSTTWIAITTQIGNKRLNLTSDTSWSCAFGGIRHRFIKVKRFSDWSVWTAKVIQNMDYHKRGGLILSCAGYNGNPNYVLPHNVLNSLLSCWLRRWPFSAWCVGCHGNPKYGLP